MAVLTESEATFKSLYTGSRSLKGLTITAVFAPNMPSFLAEKFMCVDLGCQYYPT